jgi:acyl-CoA reductase-like NAD-dependent aldehyde dehydrogenase
VYSMLINGQMSAGDKTFPVRNPATEEDFAEAPDCSKEQLDSAVEAAQKALPEWGKRSIEARRKVLLECAETLRAHAEELATLLTAEQGKTHAKGINEVMGAAAWLSYTATLDLPVEIIKDDDVSRVEVHRIPIGVVAGIIPWNYPVITAVWKFAPAILAGNTVVLKSSPYTPLATLKMAELISGIIPAGVVNVLSGSDELGKWISSHPGIRKISFTGSTASGKHVAASAADDLKRLTLELGGNDPAIVFAGVDIKSVAQKVYTACFENCGQVCVAIKRLYLHESIFQPVVDEMVVLAKAEVVGDGSDPATTIGPLNNLAQLQRVMQLLESAKADGGKVLTGGARKGDKGYFYPPTLVVDVQDDNPLVAEEQFGPIVPILSFRDTDELIKRVNNTNFGLAASVWSADLEQAQTVAAQIEAGTVWINQHLAVIPQAPIAGVKWSGVGVENGRLGLESYTEIQTISIAKG